ncbi:MAG: hypothetical protein LOY03_06315 [Cyclobacteriaceae bacterium]|nr:hypothetical protein [Cyclobacteriaceae bacterium]
MTTRVYNHIALLCFSVVLMTLTLASCDTENNLDPVYEDYFVRLFGDEGYQEGVDLVVEEATETVLLLGTTTEPDGSRRVFLVKADWAGNLIWQRKLGGPDDEARDIEPANNGGYIILTQSKDPQSADPTENVKLLLVTAEGEKTDSVVFGSPVLEGVDYGIENPNTVTTLEDGYLVTGSLEYTTTEADGGLKRVSYMKLRFTNDLEWDEEFLYYNSQAEVASGVRSVRTGGDHIYLLGSDNKLYRTENGTNHNFWLFGFDNNGLPVGNKDAPLSEDRQGMDEFLQAVCPSFGEGFFLVGTQRDPSGRQDIYVSHVANDNGALLPSGQGNRVLPSDGVNRLINPVSVCRAMRGQQGYLILGTEGDVGTRNMWLCKVSISGETVYWSSSFGAGDRNDDRAGAVAELPDGHILVVGTINVGVSNLKMGFFKLNAAGRFAPQPTTP